MAFGIPFEQPAQKPNKVMAFKSVEDLNCTVYEVSESQDFGLPEFPLDNGTFISDTVYKIPKKIDVRVLVNEADISTFISSLEASQFSNDLFSVVSVAGQVYSNLKIQGYSKTINSGMVGKVFYLISLKEIILVKALVENYQTSKNAGYTGNKNVGTKEGQERKQTALKGFTQ